MKRYRVRIREEKTLVVFADTDFDAAEEAKQFSQELPRLIDEPLEIKVISVQADDDRPRLICEKDDCNEPALTGRLCLQHMMDEAWR